MKRDEYTYYIEIKGQICLEDLAMFCPPDCRVVRRTLDVLTIALETDQAGLIGFLRSLHARGIVFEAVKRSYPLPAIAGRGPG